ncbi:hypothetical protein Tel_09110 [Candidatus Tenderia electrophaga]|uniref:3-deoxy-D-manno-octulosonic acid transferase n=1 Tax=Candidatus Tenderia electrophaga TaxID=1748243 RepID=A0A0S2TDR9_9GAMM|nr:hypothetical protein Tel_09110 [Candidatus Tenderia electrophaga]
MPESNFSDYIVYVDESGDHSLTSIDPEYPVFVLAFCIFHKRHYAEAIVPALSRFKFKHFGHDMQVLHEHDIRRQKNQLSGVQLADLVARPIGLKIIRPGQENSAFEILANKLYSKNGRQGVGTGYEGYGLKCFP